MQTSAITRLPKSSKLFLTNSINTTPYIRFDDASDARIIIPSGYSSVTLTFYESDMADGTYVACRDENSAAITLAVAAGNSYNFPAALFAVHHMKIVTNADDSTKLVTINKKC